MTKKEARRAAALIRNERGSSWPVAQEVGNNHWSLAWSEMDLTIGEVRRRRSQGLPDFEIKNKIFPGLDDDSSWN